MKLVGWCQRCHRVTQVRVSLPNPKGVQIGICDRCAEKGSK